MKAGRSAPADPDVPRLHDDEPAGEFIALLANDAADRLNQSLASIAGESNEDNAG